MEVIHLLNESSNEIIVNDDKSKWKVYLDKERLVESGFGEQCFELETTVKPIFAARARRYRFNVRHWNWILVTSESFIRCEFGRFGIVVKYYNRGGEYSSVERVLAGLNGVSKNIFFDDAFETERKLGEILAKIDDMSTRFKACKFNSCRLNCRHFAIELGKFLVPSFDPSYGVFHFIHNNSLRLIGITADMTFPKRMIIKDQNDVRITQSGFDPRVFIVFFFFIVCILVILFLSVRQFRKRFLMY